MPHKIAGGAACLFVGFGVAGSARAAAAPADDACARLRVVQPLAEEWARAADDLARQLAQLPRAECAPMALELELVAGAVVVRAVAADGRTAERSVHDPRVLVATALGLVMAIPPGDTVAPLPVAPPPVAANAPALGAVGEDRAPPTTIALAASSRLTPSVWLGLAAGGRIAAPSPILTVDIEAYANVLFGPWLVMASIRDVPTGLQAAQGIDEDAFREVSAGLGFGRRVVAGDATVDLVVEPAIVAMQMEYDFPAGSKPGEVSGGDVEFGLDAMVRLGFPVSKSWMLTITVDADFLPSNIASPARLQLPLGAMTGNVIPAPFPALTSGVRVGASGALL
jgi:hypothetical protein